MKKLHTVHNFILHSYCTLCSIVRVNRYLLFTRSGAAYSVSANFVEDAIHRVETHSGDFVSCWFIGQKMPKNVIIL